MRVYQEDITTLETQWNKLTTSDERCSIFQTWEWVSEWAKCFGEQYDIRALCARDQDSSNIVAILPLMRLRTSNEWRFLGDTPEICPDHLDIIAEQKNKLPACTAFLEFIGNNPEFAICNFDHVAEWSSLMEAAANVGGLFWGSSVISRKCHILPLSGGWDAVEKSFSDKFRKRLPYYERRLCKEFDTEIAEANPSDNINIFNELIRLHTLRWEQLGQQGAFHDKKVIHFHEGIIDRMTTQGVCKIYYLAINKKVVSVIYGFFQNNVFYFYNSGFDPEYSKYSPGVVTLAFAVKEAIKMGCKTFDFLRGNELYKEQWASEYITDWNITLHKKHYSNALPIALQKSRKIYLSFRKMISSAISRNDK